MLSLLVHCLNGSVQKNKSLSVLHKKEMEKLPATKKLHAKESEDNNEEKQKEDQGDDGLHGVHQRDNQVSQRRPVPWQKPNITFM